jgi:putative transposase
VTANPNERWVTQQARNLVMTLAEQEQPLRFLLRDRDSKFTRSFDEVFRSEGVRVIRTPVQAPKATAHAERWVGSLRRECLDRLLILGRRHLERVVRAYISHHNEHRPHRSLEQRPPLALAQPPPTPPLPTASGDATGSAAYSTSTAPSPRRRRRRLLRGEAAVARCLANFDVICYSRARETP